MNPWNPQSGPSSPVDAFWAQAAALAQTGPLRRLDFALARLLAQSTGQDSPVLAAAVMMVSQAQAHGHTALPLALLCGPDPQGVLTEEGHPLGQTWQALAPLAGPWPPTPLGWCQALQAFEAIRLGSAPDAGEPLVLSTDPRGPVLYLRRYALAEQRVAEGLRQRAVAAPHAPLPAPHKVRAVLDSLFEPSKTASPDWQKIACALSWQGRLTVITGGPGTGKTHTAARLLVTHAWLATPGQKPWRVHLAAPTGKAAARLEQSIRTALAPLAQRIPEGVYQSLMQTFPARTLHRLLGAQGHTRAWRYHAQNPLDTDLLLVDEASMIDLETWDALLAALPAHAHLVLLGDKDQLASVEAGAVMSALCQHAETTRYRSETTDWLQACTGQTLPADAVALGPDSAAGPALAQVTVMLRQSRRFDGPIGELAVAVHQADQARVQALLAQNPSVLRHQVVSQPESVSSCVWGQPGEGGWLDWARTVSSKPPSDVQAHAAWVQEALEAFDRVRVLCAWRQGPWGVEGFNQLFERELTHVTGLRPQGVWYLGRPVMVTRNSADLGLSNGDLGLVLPGPGDGPLRVWFRRGSAVQGVAPARLPHVQTAWAMTVHKSQGSEFDHAVLVLPPSASPLARELVYTGLTRARARLTLIEARPGTLAAALQHQAIRLSGLPLAWAD